MVVSSLSFFDGNFAVRVAGRFHGRCELGRGVVRWLAGLGAASVVATAQAVSFSPLVTVVEVLEVPGAAISAFDVTPTAVIYGSGGVISSYDLDSAVTTVLGGPSSPGSFGFSALIQHPSNGAVYFADDKFPDYELGRLLSGNYTLQNTAGGVFDYAVNPFTGALLVAANPGGFSPQAAIFSYDLATGTLTERITTGGYSGGLAFDADGNLFYGFSNFLDPLAVPSVFQFSASSVEGFLTSATPGTLADATVAVLGVNAGRISVGNDGTIVARSLRGDFSGTDLLVFNANGALRGILASIDGFSEGFTDLYPTADGVLVGFNDSDGNGSILSISGLSAIPEPAVGGLWLVGLLAVGLVRRP